MTRYQLQGTSNYIECLHNLQGIEDHWSLLREGLEAINDPHKANMEESPENFLAVIMKCALNWPAAAVPVLKSKNGKLLGFGAGYDSGLKFCAEKRLYIYALYSNGKCKTTANDLLSWCEWFGREHGFGRLVTETGRINGGSRAFFEKKLGFIRRRMVFHKEL